MPTRINPQFQATILYLGFSIWCLGFAFVSSAKATTNSISATASATATIPSTTPTTSDTTAPSIPILISPSDGVTTNQTRPEFIWRQSSDPNSNTVLYTLKLDGTATFLGISNIGNSQKHNYISHIGDGNIYLTPTLDLIEGEHDWTIDAYDLSSNIARSTSWHFTIDTTPPFLTLNNIDNQYTQPDLTNNPTFDLRGPKDISFSLVTEPWATISLNINELKYSYPTSYSGQANPSLHLSPGLYKVDISSFDHAGLTTSLPSFTLNITQSQIPVNIPGIPSFTIPYSPYTFFSIPSLPATISQISSRSSLALLMLILLALLLIVLLIVLWYRQPNILILDAKTHQPYHSLILYHSLPRCSYAKAGRPTILTTNHAPILYYLSPSSTYIPHLSRYSTLTIRLADATYVLSLSTAARHYTILI